MIDRSILEYPLYIPGDVCAFAKEEKSSKENIVGSFNFVPLPGSLLPLGLKDYR
jgi:hypothetical protein